MCPNTKFYKEFMMKNSPCIGPYNTMVDVIDNSSTGEGQVWLETIILKRT